MNYRKPLLSFIVAFAAAALPLKPTYAQESFIGQIVWVGFNFCPRGFAESNGQLLPISQNQALFALLGTTFGGDGRTTFALPDMADEHQFTRYERQAFPT